MRWTWTWYVLCAATKERRGEKEQRPASRERELVAMAAPVETRSGWQNTERTRKWGRWKKRAGKHGWEDLGRGDSGWQNTRSGKERAPGHFRTFEGSVLNVFVLRSRDVSPQGSLHTRRCHCPVAKRIHHPRRHGNTSSSVCRCTWALEAETVNEYYAALDGAHGRSAASRLAERSGCLQLFVLGARRGLEPG